MDKIITMWKDLYLCSRTGLIAARKGWLITSKPTPRNTFTLKRKKLVQIEYANWVKSTRITKLLTLKTQPMPIWSLHLVP